MNEQILITFIFSKANNEGEMWNFNFSSFIAGTKVTCQYSVCDTVLKFGMVLRYCPKILGNKQ